MSVLQVVLTRVGEGLDEEILVSPIPNTAPVTDVLDLLEDAVFWARKTVERATTR